MAIIPGEAQPPLDVVMPDAQIAMTYIFGVLALSALIYCIRASMRQKSALPIAIFIGSVLSVFNEPLITSIGHNWYPEVNQISLMKVHGHAIPLFVGFAYCFYFAPTIIYMIDEFEKGISKKKFWNIILGSLIFVVIYDYIGIYLGTWLYYGDAPMTIYGLPIWWMPANLMVFIPAAVILYLAKPYLGGAWAWLAVPFMFAQVLMFHGMTSLPAYSVLNMDVSYTVKTIGLLVAMALGTLLAWICVEVVAGTRFRKFQEHFGIKR